jgi:hypothetical protein
MPYFKNKNVNLLFIHIPKTGGTSLEKYLSDKYYIPLNEKSLWTNIKNGYNNVSLQHQTYTSLLTNKNKFGIQFDNINIISIVRNPYERVISDLFHFKLINDTTEPNKVYNILQKYILSDKYDNHNIPQYLFLIDKHNNINKDITIFKTETLNDNLKKYGFTDFNKNELVNNYNIKNYFGFLNNNSIKLINNIYKKDFELFNYPFINNYSIILTSTVNVETNDCIFQSNKTDRINTYLKSINNWLNNTSINIVLVENSGYQFSELKEQLNKHKHRFEIITFKEKMFEECQNVNFKKSKGASELFSINYAFKHSTFLKNSDFIIKITCRYYIDDFEKYLQNFNLNKHDALTQNNIDRCEIVGSHIDNFKKIFDNNLFDNNNNFIRHVETAYKNRILSFKNVIKCKLFDIEPTKRGGINQINTTL